MARSTKILGVSVPPEIEKRYLQLADELKMTKSELFRYLLKSNIGSNANTNRANISSVMREYWKFFEELERPIIVVGLALIKENGKFLIVQRRAQDERVPSLRWAFPGSAIQDMNIKNALRERLDKKIGPTNIVDSLISARVIPESAVSQEAVLALYFSVARKGKLKIDKSVYGKHRWVKPADVFMYFTTSTSDEITNYLLKS